MCILNDHKVLPVQAGVNKTVNKTDMTAAFVGLKGYVEKNALNKLLYLHDECMKLEEQDTRHIYSSQISFQNVQIIL